jgi:hypothetical protein
MVSPYTIDIPDDRLAAIMAKVNEVDSAVAGVALLAIRNRIS